MGPLTNSYVFACIFTFTLCNNIHPTVENEFIANYSSSLLTNVPENIPVHTHILDLSHNRISGLGISDFISLSDLQVLNLSYNLVTELNFSVFIFNEDLEYLDLSHNSILKVYCQTLVYLKHLDLSFNKFTALPICQEFGNMVCLEYLGLSATMIQRSDFRYITHLQQHTVFLTLEDFSLYEPQSLTAVNTRSLHIVFAANQNFSFPLLYDGMSTSENLKIVNLRYTLSYKDFPSPSLALLKEIKTTALMLDTVDLQWTIILQIFLLIWYSPVELLTVRNLTFRGPLGELTEYDFLPLLSSMEQLISLGGSMKVLTLEHVRNKVYYFNQEILYRGFSEMNLAGLTIYDAYMPHMLCPNRTSSFQYLNFSRNALTDELFQNCGTLTDLKLLILQRNKFESLPKVSLMTSRMKSLKYLDVSSNLLRHEGADVQCQWAESLTELDLSSNQLVDAVFECLPVNIQNLNLQNNQISSVPRGVAELKALKELNLASNRLADLPGCGGFTSLEFLNVEMNSILTPSADFFQSCPRVRELQAGKNPFKCSCELRDFIRGERQSGGRLFGWPAAYMCEYPEDLRGTQLKDFHLSELACNTVLLLVTALMLTLVLVAVVAFLCIYLDVPWYVRMTWQWTQTKRRAWYNHPAEQEAVLQFHAFVSYSERDVLWVKDELIPNLEKGEGCVQLCQHERNFIPGKSIVENIINCIEKSYKSIFVLSPNFVQSEWCHYELYFAHHKLFSENSNSLILILLEPIPPYIIPARYHKLKALMAKRTYLEWPKERSKRALFWANLRAAININLPISVGADEEQSDVTSTSSVNQYAIN
ncbi:toll-like receptor 1 isoform X1 [Neopsephotus bourkii]|uniref:toll-like receptor 1 isoform X1 n=1 Tax=Neopsephotus bourkii TaxID=309878 RepID=UPI002AA5C8EB|nr:toll-like receptor 1 isoform X1 [Neopsephotus bourkii]XP_061235898.1 toll-like receptor 1 isoform X1 [Neopsephotus bourkii]XP_061235899.1 toll-like receptor 1 isoform X1 [Neopsephotus bourkii]XP_061235900.1 toll-like receptor 1 isoform X1 [Neopsephotus bourkii]